MVTFVAAFGVIVFGGLVAVCLRHVVPIVRSWPHLRSGNAKKAKRDFKGAINDYDKIVALCPAFGFYYRGDVRRLDGDVDGALADFDQAIRLVPKSP